MLSKKQKVKFNPIHKQKDLDIINSIFGFRSGDDDEVIETHEVDFFPKFKFREVSELSIKLHKYCDEHIADIYADLKHLGEIHNYFRKSTTTDKRKQIERWFKWLDNYFGYNTWIVYDQWKEAATCERTVIHKLKFLEQNEGASRWTICFMPSLEKQAPVTFQFMCHLLNRCLAAGISAYNSDYQDMVKDYLWERMSDSGEEPQFIEEVNHELFSYKQGEPKRIIEKICSAQVTDKGLISEWNKWQQNKDCFVPLNVLEEIKEMVHLLAQDISINEYEKHERFDGDGPETNHYLFAIDWDEGHVQSEMEDSINQRDGEQGHVDLADSLIIQFNGKEGFIGKGHVLQQFLHLWNNNSIFNYFNETFENITSQADGAAICHRALQAKRKERKKPVCRTSQNRKPRNTSRNTVHA